MVTGEVFHTRVTTLQELTIDGRFIPSRTGQDLQASYSLHEPGTPSSAARSKRPSHGELNFQRSKSSSPAESSRDKADLVR